MTQPNLYVKADFTKYDLSYKDVLKLCHKQRKMYQSYITKAEKADCHEEKFVLKKKSEEMINRQHIGEGDASAIVMEWVGINEYEQEIWNFRTSLDVLIGG